MTEALEIRDRFLAKMQANAAFTGFKFTTNHSLAVQPENIPFLGVYFLEEIRIAEGDANLGAVKFRSNARYGFSLIIQNNTSTLAQSKLDAFHDIMRTILYQDASIYNWLGAGAKIQSFIRDAWSHHFGTTGQDNAIPIAELRLELTCDLGTIEYEPVVPDDLKTVHIETKWPLGGTQQEIDGEQQVGATYDIPTQ